MVESKSPALVAPDANLRVAARRIIWGKCMNSGQTCIAPDFVLCAGCDRDKLVEEMKKAVKEFYGENPKDSEGYGRIINEKQFKRIVGVLSETRGTIVHGGESDESALYIAPTIVTDVSGDDKLMMDEIFGPVLPVMSVSNVEEAVQFLNTREKPLAFYVFTESSRTFRSINDRTSAGGVTRNDTLMHYATNGLPFGGIGHSGMGSYHGKFTFDTFSHYKPVLETGTGMEFLNSMRYPPFSDTAVNRLSWFLAPRAKHAFPWKLMITFVLVAVLAALVNGLPVWLTDNRKWW